jgi:CubicO group peptidase (beta-lactamase class C family)
LDSVIEEAITNSKLVGAVLWVERNGTAYHKAYGRRALGPEPELMTEDTVFDVASVTKVVATATAAMKAVEDGLIKLEDPVSKHLPAFTGEGREKVTIRHLLLHTSGLTVNLNPATQPFSNCDEAIGLICREKLQFAPGSAYSYSSVGSLLLGAVIERVSAKPLDEFCTGKIFRPLRMTDTLFRPQGERLRRVAPTDLPERGRVNDHMARAIGGVAGHASLFTTAPDLARFARMMLNFGELDGARVLRPETVRLMTSVQSSPGLRCPAANNLPVRRALGYDIDTPYRTPPHEYSLHRGAVFPVGSYGHAGWTGQALWIDPFSRTFFIFLCNRYHGGPIESPLATYRLHYRLATLAAEAVKGFDFQNVPGALPRTPTPTASK